MAHVVVAKLSCDIYINDEILKQFCMCLYIEQIYVYICVHVLCTQLQFI